MSVNSFIVIASLAAVSLSGALSSAAAQIQPPARTGPPYAAMRPYPRIEVNPRPLLYRRCVDWYALQYRPSGTVLFPEQHCWWVRG